MKKNILYLLFSLAFCTSIYASYPPMPERCPDIKQIQTQPFVQVKRESYSDSKWVVYQNYQSYGTEDLWTFTMGGIVAMDAKEALQIANNSLSTLRITGGPDELMDEPKWICTYKTAQGYEAGAVTPVSV